MQGLDHKKCTRPFQMHLPLERTTKQETEVSCVSRYTNRRTTCQYQRITGFPTRSRITFFTASS